MLCVLYITSFIESNGEGFTRSTKVNSLKQTGCGYQIIIVKALVKDHCYPKETPTLLASFTSQRWHIHQCIIPKHCTGVSFLTRMEFSPDTFFNYILGFTGPHCIFGRDFTKQVTILVNRCLELPIFLSRSYQCKCDAGWAGVNCDVDKDECESNPCQQGGTCENLVNGYKCTCVKGFKGEEKSVKLISSK